MDKNIYAQIIEREKFRANLQILNWLSTYFVFIEDTSIESDCQRALHQKRIHEISAILAIYYWLHEIVSSKPNNFYSHPYINQTNSDFTKSYLENFELKKVNFF